MYAYSYIYAIINVTVGSKSYLRCQKGSFIPMKYSKHWLTELLLYYELLFSKGARFMNHQRKLYEQSLLEYLADATKNSNISSLFYDTPFSIISRTISRIPADAYPLQQWEEAANYLLRENITFLTAEDAAGYLSAVGRSIHHSPHGLLSAKHPTCDE